MQQSVYLSTAGLGELLNITPRILSTLDVIREEGEGEMSYPLQYGKRARCATEAAANGPEAMCVIETSRDGSVVSAFSLAMTRSEISSLSEKSERIKAVIHEVAKANGMMGNNVGLPEPQMMSVFRYYLHDKDNQTYERGVWCPVSDYAKYEGLQSRRAVSEEKPELRPLRVDMWQKRIRVPSHEEL